MAKRPARAAATTDPAGSDRPPSAGSARMVTLHRVLAAPPEKVWRAFVTADALTRWMPPYGFTAAVEHVDVRPGGTFRMSFTNFTTGSRIAFGGTYLEVVAGARLRYTDVFDDPALPGEMMVTVDLGAVSVGTDLRIEQAGIPDVIPLDACYLGWQQSLAQLQALVEPVIPG